MFEVMAIGNCCVDVIYEATAAAQTAEKAEASHLWIQGGGPAATAAVALARSGQRVSFVGQVGSDPFGAFIRADFAGENVATDFLQTSNETTRISCIIVDRDTGRRRVMARSARQPLPVPPLLLREISDCRLLLLDGHEINVALAAAQVARQAGVPVVTGVGSLRSRVNALISRSTWVVVSEKYWQQVAAESPAERLLQRICDGGAAGAIVTLGERGSLGLSSGTCVHVPAMPVRLADPTGAGDAYLAGFALGILHRLPFEQCMRLATQFGGLNCRAIGGRGGLPSAREVEDILSKSRI